ncbi:MAG: cytochrome b [Candidimonas sp.]|nr:MAG: cytochrome b [Candidimonas sp.]TAM26820.1 MAG: cytochrome b [Candidimonas sp.]TAM79291.1 MAG: cytochrome b [Candidimonas sp.]
MIFNSPAKYGIMSRFFHGFCAVSVIAALIFIEIKPYFPKGGDGRALMQYAHMQAGLFVLWLIAPRILWRSANSEPAVDPAQGRFIKAVANLTHYMLYALMLVLPILGVLTWQASGHTVDFFGITLPAIVGSGAEVKTLVKSTHEFLGNVMLYLVILHVLAALWHHFVVKDTTFIRMFGR